jgi:hypothetical protein
LQQAFALSPVHDLIEICREGEACYKACVKYVRDVAIKRLLRHRAHCVVRARRALMKLRRRIGDAMCVGSPLYRPVAPQRPSGSYQFAVTDEASALGLCERLEAVAMMRYRDALDFELPEAVRVVLQQQFDGLIQGHTSRSRTATRSDSGEERESAARRTVAWAP